METLFDEVKSEEERINRELTEHAKSRIANNLQCDYDYVPQTYEKLRKKVGDERIPSEAHSKVDILKSKIGVGRGWLEVSDRILGNSDTIVVFTYLQMIYSENFFIDTERNEVVDILNEILETENILWRAEDNGGDLDFERLVSEEMESADRKVRESFESGNFQRSMEAYNDAWRMFSDEEFSYKVPEKLYNAIEEVLKEICVEKEDWLDSKELSHRNYLEELSDRDIFYPNKIMRAEAEDLMDSMEKFVSKAGKERKNQHSNIDEEYSRLLIHQTAAYLDFIITRYQSGDFRE